MNTSAYVALTDAVRAWNASAPSEFRIREPGVSQDTLRRTEARLGLKLPADYSAFLILSNGWASTGDTLGVRGLRAVENIAQFAEAEAGWLASWQDADPDADDPSIALMRRATVLSTPGERALLLDPLTRDPSSGEPMCVFFDNDAPGIAGSPRSFTAALMELCERQPPLTATHPGQSISSDPKVAAAYGRALGGDIQAIDDLERMAQRNWFAYSIVKQRQLLTNRIGRLADVVSMLWSGGVPPLPSPSLLAEPLLHEEILPLYAQEVFSRKRLLDDDIAFAPPPIAETLDRCRASLEAGAELTASFDYAPDFATAVDRSRKLLTNAPDEAWRIIVEALPAWRPRCDHHLAPLGLRIDSRLRQLLLDKAAFGVIPPRTTELLSRPRGPDATGSAPTSDPGHGV
jgi:hypothetical protein